MLADGSASEMIETRFSSKRVTFVYHQFLRRSRLSPAFLFTTVVSEQTAKPPSSTTRRCLSHGHRLSSVAPLTGSVGEGCGNLNTREIAISHAYSRLRIIITALGPRAFKPLPFGIGLKTANQAKSEGLVEADGELSSKAKYRLTPAGAARKTLYGGTYRKK